MTETTAAGCIDKSSSAELSEAINSMFRWYQRANTCYAFLQDVSRKAILPDSGQLEETLFKSRWFSRGWTLQELLAPVVVHFYSAEWQPSFHPDSMDGYLGSKSSLRKTISRITGISEAILEGRRGIESASVAQRMSWAAHRSTSRLEDEVCISNFELPSVLLL